MATVFFLSCIISLYKSILNLFGHLYHMTHSTHKPPNQTCLYYMRCALIFSVIFYFFLCHFYMLAAIC